MVERYVKDRNLRWIDFNDLHTPLDKNATFPFIKGTLPKETFLYISKNAPKYMRLEHDPDMSSEFVYTAFEVHKANYLELMKQGVNPFFEDLIGMMQKIY